jgi:hypothetical protein
MTVTRRQIMNELAMELDKTRLDHTEDNFADMCDTVVVHWKSVAQDNLDRGYATGEYRNSIHRETVRATRASGGNLGGWKSRAVTYDEIAHLLEYGTGPDEEGVGSWFSIKDGRWHRTPNTPTPAFGIAAEVEMDMNSTFAKQGKKRKRPAGGYPDINRGNRPTNQELFADWEANNPEAAERYRNNRTSASIRESWLRYSDKNPT